MFRALFYYFSEFSESLVHVVEVLWVPVEGQASEGVALVVQENSRKRNNSHAKLSQHQPCKGSIQLLLEGSIVQPFEPFFINPISVLGNV